MSSGQHLYEPPIITIVAAALPAISIVLSIVILLMHTFITPVFPVSDTSYWAMTAVTSMTIMFGLLPIYLMILVLWNEINTTNDKVIKEGDWK